MSNVFPTFIHFLKVFGYNIQNAVIILSNIRAPCKGTHPQCNQERFCRLGRLHCTVERPQSIHPAECPADR